jgi:hypothetical protein
MPLTDLTPIVRGSSCTATPPDAVALAAAESWRMATLGELVRTGGLPAVDRLRDPLVTRMLHLLGLPPADERRVVLTASGTDVETIAAALALAASDRPLRNVLVGSLEAGSGTALAAAGRYFRGRTPFRSGVTSGDVVTGFPTERVRVVDVELRDNRGRARRPFDVEAEVEAHLEDAVEHGERVLVHVMGGSKTGLRQIDPTWVRAWRALHPDHLRVVVDAAQARLSAAQVREYLDAGASVSLTGSKALSAPPFCGVLLLDDALLADADRALDSSRTLPGGLRDLVAAADLPAHLRPLLPGAEPVNLGLLARWAVAIDEAERLASIPLLDRDLFVTELVAGLTEGLGRLGGVRVLPVSGPFPTIIPFSVLDATGTPLGKKVLGELYSTIVTTPGVQLGQPVELTPGGAAALRYAIGSATVTRALMGGEAPHVAAARVVHATLDVLDLLLPDHALV